MLDLMSFLALILIPSAGLMLLSMPRAVNFRAFKVGGLTFVRLGMFSMSFCVTRKPFHAEG